MATTLTCRGMDFQGKQVGQEVHFAKDHIHDVVVHVAAYVIM